MRALVVLLVRCLILAAMEAVFILLFVAVALWGRQRRRLLVTGDARAEAVLGQCANTE